MSGKVKTKPQKQTGGLKLDMDFDEAMRRALRVKPVKQSAKPPAKRKTDFPPHPAFPSVFS